MRTHSLWVLAPLAGLALAACASHGPSRYAESNLATDSRDAELTTFRLRNWSVVNDHTLLFESTDGTCYKAETFGPCMGLEFAPRVSFTNRGGFSQIDRFTSVMLPDGTRCSFQSFGRVVEPATKALDSFEKLGQDTKGGATER